MELAEFMAAHCAALERDEVRHNLILGLLNRAAGDPDHRIALWSLGEPGACAIRMPGRGILLGEVSEAQARELARLTAGLDYPSVIGVAEAPAWFVAEAERFGLRFRLTMMQRIHALSRPPDRPEVHGAARPIDPERDVELLHRYTVAFIQDAALEDPAPSREESARKAQDRRHWFWEVDGEPVAMAGLGRVTRNVGSIAPVYTAPQHRNRGFGGAVTSAVVDAIFAKGLQTACLFTDLSNPAAIRCYAKLGFEPVCDSRIYRRVQAPEAASSSAEPHPRSEGEAK